MIHPHRVLFLAFNQISYISKYILILREGRKMGRDTLNILFPFFDLRENQTISHPIGQDPMILCINAQAASSGDLAQGFGW
jgi:hypothetical protein